MNILEEGGLDGPEGLFEHIMRVKPSRVVYCHDEPELDYYCIVNTSEGVIFYIGTKDKFAVWLQEEGKVQ